MTSANNQEEVEMNSNSKQPYEEPANLACVGSYESHIFISENSANLKIDLGAFEGFFGPFDGEVSDNVAQELDSVLYALVHCATNNEAPDAIDKLNSAHWMLSYIRDCFRAMRIRNTMKYAAYKKKEDKE